MKTRILLLTAILSALLFSQAVATGNGTKAVTTAGTRVTLTASDTIVKWVTVQALSTNTGIICVGGPTVLVSTRTGTCLTAGQAAPMYFMAGFPYNLAAIYIDSSVNGESVAYTYAQ